MRNEYINRTDYRGRNSRKKKLYSHILDYIGWDEDGNEHVTGCLIPIRRTWYITGVVNVSSWLSVSSGTILGRLSISEDNQMCAVLASIEGALCFLGPVTQRISAAERPPRGPAAVLVFTLDFIKILSEQSKKKEKQGIDGRCHLSLHSN